MRNQSDKVGDTLDKDDFDTLRETSLAYFGQMSASISHEIKNSLAIINENAGLMEDLSTMAIAGRPLDPERIKALCGKVIQQIKRADDIVKKMNKFAHTVDDPLNHVNLADIVDLTISMGQRSAASYGVTILLTPPPAPISIRTNAFLLMNLLWMLMKFCCPRTDESKTVNISILKDETKIVIEFSKLGNLTNNGSSNLFLEDKSTKELFKILNAAFQIDHDRGIIEMIINI